MQLFYVCYQSHNYSLQFLQFFEFDKHKDVLQYAMLNCDSFFKKYNSISLSDLSVYIKLKYANTITIGVNGLDYINNSTYPTEKYSIDRALFEKKITFEEYKTIYDSIPSDLIINQNYIYAFREQEEAKKVCNYIKQVLNQDTIWMTSYWFMV